MDRTAILAAMQAIVDGAAAENRSMSDEEVATYEQHEQSLQALNRSEEIARRQSAYNSPVNPAVPFADPRVDDTQERAFEHYLRTGQVNSDLTQNRDQNVGTPADGGYLVPDGFRAKLVEARKAFGGLSTVVENISTATGNPLEWPSLNDTGNVGQITAEAADFDGGADLVFGVVNLGAYKFTSAGANDEPLKVSVELLQDSEFDIQGLVSRKLGERIARKQADVWCNGDGSGEPLGIAWHADGNGDIKLATGNALTVPKLLDVESLLDPAYEANASWVMNKKSWMACRAIEDAADRPVLMAQAEAGIGTRPQRMLFGYPVIIDQNMPDIVNNAIFAVFGDLREGYVIRRVSNLAVMVNPYSSGKSGQVEFTAWERADGTVQNRAAYKTLSGFDAT